MCEMLTYNQPQDELISIDMAHISLQQHQKCTHQTPGYQR